MANIAISSICNLSCPYCFAASHMIAARDDNEPAFIPLESFKERLDFLDRSGIDQARLIGGEPTLHPQFPQLIELIRERGKHIVLFSHGLIPQRSLSCLTALPENCCTILINMNATRHESGPSAHERERRLDVLKQLGPRALIGFNIYQAAFEFSAYLPLIEESGCRREIRLGLAQPIMGGENQYLHPKQYPAVGSRIVSFARQAAEYGVQIQFDCGFIRCMFAPEDVQVLEALGTDVACNCSPILDIDIGGTAVHCFPLTGIIQTGAGNGLYAQQLQELLLEQTSAYRTAGIYRECSTCSYKAGGQCTGGCLAATMRRFHHQPFSIQVPA